MKKAKGTFNKVPLMIELQVGHPNLRKTSALRVISLIQKKLERFCLFLIVHKFF